MQAVVFDAPGAPDVLHLVDLPDPVATLEQVLIDVAATTVNRLDTFQRAGTRPLARLPAILGLEAAGTVVHDGHGFKAGDRVVTTRAMVNTAQTIGGGYASRLALSPDVLVRIPDGVSFEQAAAVGLAGSTAWTTLFDWGKMRDGERVLVTAGASGVGTVLIQLIKAHGGWVAATAGGADKAERLRALGADLVIDHKAQPIGATVRNAGGVNLVMENVSSTLAESLTACLPDARIVLIGNAGGREATVDTQAWRLKRVTVTSGGSMVASVADEQKLIQMVADGTLRPMIDRTLPIAQAAEAHRLIEANQAFGKIILAHRG